MDDWNNKDYGFALYDNELEMIQTMAHYPTRSVWKNKVIQECLGR